MSMSTVKAVANGRPYRSHKIPACYACKKRKVACKFDGQSRSCQYCLSRRLNCSWPSQDNRLDDSATSASPTAAVIPTKRTELDAHDESSPLIIHSAMAEDVQMVERYLGSTAAPCFPTTSSYIQVPNTQGETIMYHSIPRTRKGLILSAKNPGAEQREIIEQILRPCKADVVHLYFDKIHPCFPILDVVSFWNLWESKADRLSHTLVCDIYAISIVFWDTVERFRGLPRPDSSFIWNQAVIALRDDFMLPKMTTIHAALLDLAGRPVGWVAGNILNVGRTVALAHSLGLHRNSYQWHISEHEKHLRTRLWWGVIIHDHWSSVSHGTPPNIYRDNYDVPLPSLATLGNTRVSVADQKSLSTFIHLCSLTEILGEMLPLLYDLRCNIEEAWKTLRRIECGLDQWEDNLPHYMNLSKFREDGSMPRPNGDYSTPSRSQDNIGEQEPGGASRIRKLPKSALNNAATGVINYTLSLQEEQLQEFWLPYTSHMLVLITTISMRCAVESKAEIEKEASISTLVRLMAHLKAARNEFNWDIADFCLERCATSVESMASHRRSPPRPSISSNKLPAHTSEILEPSQTGAHMDCPNLPYNVFDIDNFWSPFWDNFDNSF